ncbi:ABC-type transport system, periplasmic component [Herbaspirillum rubrisubalbicans M1]|uniref:transporter substrate-binding domain-containing protein n=1 Tax=Herbaspirillum rubrisubalbicans TaxID=80842 RepID=UPI00073ACD00|nr:transporter substrate-binding domain-containing protein [Herbaspirillum rubrisubalbicans]ALU90505.1 ABC-type transport system, periplasmic component [Herbaspirillum rubrisubalbicans M1]
MRRLHCLLLLALLAFNVSAHAGVVDDARRNGQLRIGLDHVPPTYKAGMKFRTPENIATVLAEDLAVQWKLKPELQTNAAERAALKSLRPELVLTRMAADAATTNDLTQIPTGYSAGGMAIMRSDTSIRKWEDLKGRSVCVSAGSPYVGTLAARYGAIEKVMPAPADSLLAVRIGQCDAAVHDDTLLKVLLKLPEWKKFSAQLAPVSRQTLVLQVRGNDAADLAAARQAAARWNAAFWEAAIKKWVNNVAFEVYLDQNVPDCH